MFVLSLNKEKGEALSWPKKFQLRFFSHDDQGPWYTTGTQLVYKWYRNVLTGSVAGSTSISQHLASTRQRLQDRRLSLLDSGPLPK